MWIKALDLKMTGMEFASEMITEAGASDMTIVGYQVISLGVFAAVTSDSIQKPNDPITTWALAHIGLERGTIVRAGIFAIGAIGAVTLLVEWATAGFAAFPFTVLSLASFTAIVIGLQTVFSSFFLSSVEQ